MSITDYKLTELKDLASTHRVPMRSKMNKASLFQALMNLGVLTGNTKSEGLYSNPNPDSVTECFDWTQCVTKDNINGWDILIIPKGTLLFQGVGIRKNYLRSIGRISESYADNFFGNLAVASFYAFSSDIATGEYGKVLTFNVDKDIILFDADSVSNYDKIYNSGISVPSSEIGNQDLIEYAFGYTKGGTLKRYSHELIDLAFVDWFCKNFTNFNGYAYLNLPGLTTEVFICDLSLLTVLDVEYRFVSYYDPKSILKVVSGEFTGETITFKDLPLFVGGRKIDLRPNFSSIYTPVKTQQSDKFLFDEPFMSKREMKTKYSF
jgi:hypothetical protein